MSRSSKSASRREIGFASCQNNIGFAPKVGVSASGTMQGLWSPIMAFLSFSLRRGMPPRARNVMPEYVVSCVEVSPKALKLDRGLVLMSVRENGEYTKTDSTFWALSATLRL